MRLELPPPIPAKRASPTKVEPTPRNEASPSVKPLPAVPPPLPPQVSPPPIPPALRTPAPSNEKPGGTSAERTAQSTPWLFVGLAIMGFGLLMVWANSSSRTKAVSNNSGSFSAPLTETPVAGSSTGDSTASQVTASTSESSPAPSPSVDEVERRLEDMRKSYAAAFSAASPTTSSESVQPTAASPQTYHVIQVKRGDSLNLRQGPGSDYPIVATIPAGFRGITLGTQQYMNGTTVWQEISVGDYNGYVNKIYLEADFPSAVPRAVKVR